MSRTGICRREALRLMGGSVLAVAGCRSARGGAAAVGSKNFTEQIILGELLAQQIEGHTSLRADRRLNLGGTLLCHRAVLAGELDLYVEYTGTALTAILGQPPQADPAAVLGAVRDAYRERFGLEVEPPLGFNNTFAIVVRAEDAARLGLRTISDLVPHAQLLRPGFGYEFMERPDGYRGLSETYGLRFAAAPRIMDLGLLYRALGDGQVDVVAGNSTDGLIAALGMVVLQDDRRFFPPYEAVAVVRSVTLERYPDLRSAVRALTGTISDEDMRRMNYAVDGERRDPSAVARDFRQRRGL